MSASKPGNKKEFDEKMKQLAIKRKSIPTPPSEKSIFFLIFKFNFLNR